MFAEVAVKNMENGVQVEAVLVVETVKVWLVPQNDFHPAPRGPMDYQCQSMLIDQ